MGLFDFFSRKTTPPPKELDDEGPSHHYVFAHIAMRSYSLAKPLQTLAISASPEARSFLAALLEDVEESLERKADFSPEEIKIDHLRLGRYPCAIYTMPEPKNPVEARMFAVVALLDLESSGPLENTKGRFFTLEKGVVFDDVPPHNVLAEWSESTHSNYGEGPPADVHLFADAISKHL